MTEDRKFPWSEPWEFLRDHLQTSTGPAKAVPSPAQRLTALQNRLKPFLKSAGFRGAGRSFNRTTSDGLIQVFTFQMGRQDPPETVYYPPFTENLYGQFTINIGVFIPEVHSLRPHVTVVSIIPEVACTLRTRLGELGPEQDDLWWPIEDNDHLAAELEDRIRNDAFPFFAQFETRDLYLASADLADELGYDMHWRITTAIILNTRGNLADARELLMEQIEEAERTGAVAHARYVRDLAADMGLGPV